MKLGIAGDLSLQDRAVRCNWDEAELKRSFDEISVLIKGCTHAIVNLESPVTNHDKPIVKDGPSLKNDVKVFDIIKHCGFDTVALANNHLKDYGFQGIIDTLLQCKINNINYIGAGNTVVEARQPLVYTEGGLKVGVLNVCEHESSIATNMSAGAAPVDLANLFYDIKELRKQVDKVIIIIHGGCEHYQLPTPRMKRDYHLIIDFGADVIVNHHQHCYSGYEIYNGKLIFYGLGNFFFDNPIKRHDKWNEALLLKLDITMDNTQFGLIPYNQCDDVPRIKVKDFEEVKGNIEELNAIIADDKQLNERFDQLVASKKPLYPFLPYGNHYLRALYNRGFLPDCMGNLRKVKMENVVSCETHREVLLRYFENMLKHE